MKKLIAVILLTVMLMACASAVAESYGAKILSEKATVYASNGGETVTGTLSCGTSVSVTGISGNWARISYKGHTGYTSMKNLVFNKSIKAKVTKDATLVFVTKKSYAADTAYRVTAEAGTVLNVVGYFDGKALVESNNGAGLGVISASVLAKAD